MPIDQTHELTLEDVAFRTKLQLAWFACVYWYLHTQKKIVNCKALRIRHRKDSCIAPERYTRIVDRAISIINEAEKEDQVKPEDDPGHYLNKATVLYMMTAIDRFVEKVHSEVCPESRTWPLSQRLCEIANNLKGFFDNPITRRIRLLAEIRNNIAHGFGLVDKRLLDQAHLADDWPELAGGEFRKTNKESPKINLDITRVGLPGLEYCLDFVDFTVNAVQNGRAT